MAEKTKLKWLRKEFSSSEELEYYLTQLKHQDKLKSDIIALLERFQHLLFQDYEPDFLTIAYNGQWDVSFGPSSIEEAKQKIDIAKPSPPMAKGDLAQKEAPKPDAKKNTRTSESAGKPAKLETRQSNKEESRSKSLAHPNNKEENKSKPTTRYVKESKKRTKSKTGERIDLTDLLTANLLSVGAKLKHKTQANVLGVITRDGNIKIGKEEYSSLSGAATSLASSGRRDGWLCWLFQDTDGDWKTVDLLRTRWKQKFVEG